MVSVIGNELQAFGVWSSKVGGGPFYFEAILQLPCCPVTVVL